MAMLSVARVTALIDSRQSLPNSAHSRRSFLAGSMVSVVTAALHPFLAINPVLAEVDPLKSNAADLELAALGEVLRKAEPETAARLEAWGREASGLSATQKIDWTVVNQSRLLLTERTRVAAEFDRGEIIFVAGWLLARSEAATALLYASVLAGSGPQNLNSGA